MKKKTPAAESSCDKRGIPKNPVHKERSAASMDEQSPMEAALLSYASNRKAGS